MDKSCLSLPVIAAFLQPINPSPPSPVRWGGLQLQQPAYGLGALRLSRPLACVLLCLQFAAKCQSISPSPSVMSLKSTRNVPPVSDPRGHSLLVTNHLTRRGKRRQQRSHKLSAVWAVFYHIPRKEWVSAVCSCSGAASERRRTFYSPA